MQHTALSVEEAEAAGRREEAHKGAGERRQDEDQKGKTKGVKDRREAPEARLGGTECAACVAGGKETRLERSKPRLCTRGSAYHVRAVELKGGKSEMCGKRGM